MAKNRIGFVIAEKPDDVRGIAVSGMPVGSPGTAVSNALGYGVPAHWARRKPTGYAMYHGLAH